jgi:transposase
VKRTVELAVDECHLLWGDACGYAWSPRNTRASVPITNIRTRQSYYGALNILTGWAVLWKATAGNTENTVQFLTYLRQYFQGRRMIILWDGASYHTAHLVRDYLTRINGPTCPMPQRKIHLVQFAPAAPLQNPMEDVWLAGKRQVRTQWTELTTFADVQTVFSTTIKNKQFLFNKLNWYGREQLIAGRRLLGFRWE